MVGTLERGSAAAAYNAFLAQCPTRQLLDAISDKWVALTLAALSKGPRRYGQISKVIVGVSPKMLTQTLRALERDGLVNRRVTPTVPVRVDYELTPLGETLMELMLHIKDWAETHIDEVHVAQRRYDTSDDMQQVTATTLERQA